MHHLAPIALFVYNRPEHTRRTLSFLQKNLLADESRLFIYSDAAKDEADIKKVDETRELVKTIEGFKSVKIIERKESFGLAASIIDGVSELTKEYGKVIVFEDDLLASPFTLRYFNEALRTYQDEQRVMQISAYMFPLKNAENLPETFFFRATTSWGWATWERAWNHFEPNVSLLYQQFDQSKIKDFSIDGSMNYWKQLLDFKSHKNNSWSIRWYASVFLNKGLVLHPRESLIDNIGHDGTGVHSIIEDTYQVTISRKPIRNFASEIKENKEALAAIKHFFKYRKGSLFKRGKKFLINKWHQIFKS
jgi:hypothetical protein